MKKILLAASLVLAGSHSAQALGTGSGGVAEDFGDNSLCEVYVTLMGSDAFVQLKRKNVPQSTYVRYSGPGLYSSGQWQDQTGRNLFSSDLDYCFNGGGVTNFVDLADKNLSFASSTVLGFSFDHGGQSYEYSLKGTTTTVVTAGAADTSAPTLASSNPADNFTGAAVGSNIVLTFNENIQVGSGNIVISDGVSDTRTIPVGDPQITISGTTLTINPTADLNFSTGYYVQVAATAVDDIATNRYAGITDTTTLNFTTAAPPTTTSGAPTALVATPGNAQVSVAFTAPANNGGAAITNYEYSTDGGTSWTAFSPATTVSPATITGLTNGTRYSIVLRAVNSVGNGTASGAVSSTPVVPVTTSGAPTALVATPGNAQVSVAFTAPANTGGAVISDYEYQLDGGSWVSASTTSSPVTISGLTNGTSYSIALRAVNSAGSGTASSTTTVTPATTSDAPTALVATPGNAQVSVAFTAPANTGGAAITDYEYQLDGGSWVSANTTSSPVTISGLTNGTSYSIALRAVNSAGNGAASAAVSFDTPSPATAFSEYEADIRLTIVNDATRNLQSVVGANRLMTQNARQRFVKSKQESLPGQAMLFINNDVPLDVNGTADISGTTLSTKGTFFGQTGNAEGTQRRLVFGDFDVQHDGNTGSSTATLTGRMAWEQMTSSDTMLGYFIGGELARSNIEGAFAGDQNRIGVTVGGYGVHSLSDNLFVDGFVTLGAGRNNLTMANDVLALDSDYTTRTATVGGTLSGRIEQKDFDIWPELSFVYGRTWIGDVGFTGRAYGLVDDTLSLNAGSVTLANVMFRPEFRIPLDGLQASKSLSLLTFAPRMICEQVKATTTTKNCGSGAEFGIATHSADGLSNVNAKILADRLGNNTKSGLQFNLEHRF